jgi:uncharacterized protein
MGSERPARRVSEQIVALAAAMRRGGVRCGLAELLGAHEALAAVDCADRVQSYHALRAALCGTRADYAIFDEAFEATFAGVSAPVRSRESSTAPASAEAAVGAATAGQDDAAAAPAGWSDLERLRETDFADLSPEQLAAVAELMRPLARRGPTRRTRRTIASHRRLATRHASVDVRGTIRASLRSGGEPIRRRWRVRTVRPRRLVVVCDVSGSMRPYAEGLLLYVQALVAARRDVEAFVFGTRLTRVTVELAGRDPQRALARLGGVVEDWAGGTRIGESLRTLNCEHGGRIGRGATVIVLSDGWDRGATEQLSSELARLRRTAHRLCWLNPLKSRPGYEPLARGMAAALPHLDAFLAGNSLAGLEELAGLLAAGFDA